MNKKILITMVLMGVILISGCYQCPNPCPDCYCNCPSCEPDTRPITKFEHPDNIILFNEEMLITKEEILDSYIITAFRIDIRAYKGGLNKSKLCIEHKFKDVEVYDTFEVSTPKNYTIRKDYRIDCWGVNELEDFERIEYRMVIETEENQNQTVKISIWENE